MTFNPSAFRWLSLVVVIWLQSVNGTNTNFPAYSSQLKHHLSMSQFQLNNLAFASDAAKLVAWLSGFAALYLPLWLVLLLGSTLGLIGYGVQYLFLTNHIISSLSYAHVFCLTLLAGNSICWINTVCYVTVIRNFPSKYRQVANGLTTSFQGLSAKIYTDIVDVVFNSPPTKRAQGYVLLNAILPVIVSVIYASLARDVGEEGITDMKIGFVAMFLITVITGVYAVLSSLKSISTKVLSPLGILVVMCVLLLLPLEIPLSEKIKVEKEKKMHNNNINISLEKLESGVIAEEEEAREVAKEEEVMEEIGVKKMVKRVNFWLYFFVYLLGATLGLVFFNNLGQIAESRRCQGTSYLVSLSSSFNFFGRLLPSLLDFCFSRSKYMISRPASVVASMAPMVVAFFLLLSKTSLALYTSTAVIGVCTGAITTLSVSTTIELFGTKKFGINHNIVIANIPIGSLLFGYSAALVYHKHGNGDGKCLGMECYRHTFIHWGSLCFVGTLLALALYFRTRKFYSTRDR